jgi:hypothetical protein
MKKSHRLCALTVILGIIGCESDQAENTPAATPPASSTTPPAPSATKTPPAGGAPTATPSSPAKEEEPKTTPGKETSKADAPSLEGPKSEASGDKSASAKLSDAEIANIKKLPEAEQAAALAQAICPVSEEHLGGMGKPIKISAEGRTFYLCCDSCEKDVKADPKGVIAKLEKK